MMRRVGLNVISITIKDVVKSKLDIFNKSKSAILITTIVPFIDLVGVINIHIMDNYSVDVYKIFLQWIHKSRCCRASKSKPLCHIYIAVYQKLIYEWYLTFEIKSV